MQCFIYTLTENITKDLPITEINKKYDGTGLQTKVKLGFKNIFNRNYKGRKKNMIKPITFQGAVNFKASLYALEIRSRFIDQSSANGYFKNYGRELAMINSSPSTITIGTGAFCVQGRMAEVTSQEVLTIDYSQNNGIHELMYNVGYVLAKIQTYQLNSENNCS